MSEEEAKSYRILASFGLPLNFNETDLTKAYRKAMKQYHPEQGNTSNADMSIKINNAKDILNNSLNKSKTNTNQELVTWQNFTKIIEEFIPHLEFANIHVNPALQYEINEAQNKIINLVRNYKEKANMLYKEHDMLGLDNALRDFYGDNGHFINSFINTYLNRWYVTNSKMVTPATVNSIMGYIANYDIRQMTLEEAIKLINNKAKEHDNIIFDLNNYKRDTIAALKVKYDSYIVKDTNEFLKRITIHFVDKANAILRETFMEINVLNSKDLVNNYINNTFMNNYFKNIQEYTKEYLYSWNKISNALSDNDLRILIQDTLKAMHSNISFNDAKEIINTNIFKVSRQPLTVIQDTLANIKRKAKQSEYYKILGPQMDAIINANGQDIYNIYQISLRGLSNAELNAEIKSMKTKINKELNALIRNYYHENNQNTKIDEVYYLCEKKAIKTEVQLNLFLDKINHPQDIKAYDEFIKKLILLIKAS
jgi:curved DNA-binding protein CbpA